MLRNAPPTQNCETGTKGMTQGASNDDSNHLLQFTYTVYDYDHNAICIKNIEYHNVSVISAILHSVSFKSETET